jgi:hypothetical protein
MMRFDRHVVRVGIWKIRIKFWSENLKLHHLGDYVDIVKVNLT